ncbi:beta-class phenol-soluble modulin [Staphylococcus durrellii]|nr:beta-class phenol-soluble modulin [Staphylococcus durrellii]MBF7015955.1 beta-class phenol-soluble modulin [Staphylococcus durrellii]
MSGIVEAISNAVKSGLGHDWVSMGTSIADAVAKGIDSISGLIG